MDVFATSSAPAPFPNNGNSYILHFFYLEEKIRESRPLREGSVPNLGPTSLFVGGRGYFRDLIRVSISVV